MFRKDPEALAQWSPENVKLCVARQRRIVADVWPALKEGGWLLYSTCTFNSSENDGNVEWICRELGAEVVLLSNAPHSFCRQSEPDSLPVEGAVETRCGLQLGMGLTRGEGQYVALLRKTSAQKAGPQPKVSKPSRKVPCDWLESGVAAYEQSTSAGIMLKAYPEQTEAQLRFFESSLRAIRSGVAVAYVKGRDLVPQTDLALSRVFRREAFAQAELTRDQALQFLRCAALQLPDAPRGFNAVTYECLPLGFVKNLGNRANNLFPQAWRLRM
jgi:NOL1/NOP2/fmu family ribosome biogenesis protein